MFFKYLVNASRYNSEEKSESLEVTKRKHDVSSSDATQGASYREQFLKYRQEGIIGVFLKYRANASRYDSEEKSESLEVTKRKHDVSSSDATQGASYREQFLKYRQEGIIGVFLKYRANASRYDSEEKSESLEVTKRKHDVSSSDATQGASYREQFLKYRQEGIIGVFLIIETKLLDTILKKNQNHSK